MKKYSHRETSTQIRFIVPKELREKLPDRLDLVAIEVEGKLSFITKSEYNSKHKRKELQEKDILESLKG